MHNSSEYRNLYDRIGWLIICLFIINITNIVYFHTNIQSYLDNSVEVVCFILSLLINLLILQTAANMFKMDKLE